MLELFSRLLIELLRERCRLYVQELRMPGTSASINSEVVFIFIISGDGIVMWVLCGLMMFGWRGGCYVYM